MNTSERKRPRRDDTEVERREKLSRTDLICPICFDLFKEVQVTSCGHSFCHSCIERCLHQSPECPVCKQSLPPNVVRFAPNFTVNDIVAKIKSSEKCHTPMMVRSEVKSLLSMVTKLSSEEFQKLRREMDAQFEEIEKEEDEIAMDVYVEFIEESRRRKKLEFEKVKTELESLEEELKDIKSSQRSSDLSESGTTKRAYRLHQLHTNFEDIQGGYFASQDPLLSSEQPSKGVKYSFKETLVDITRYSSFRDMATLFYGDLPVSSSSSIVSSIEFDKDGDFFAVGGVTKKIKIYEYGMVSAANPKFTTLHYPVIEIPCQAKLSSVCYNPYLKHQLAASDYDGALSVWDTHHQKCLHSYQEHEKRVWSVSYNSYDPALIATGGDDCSLKLWHLTKSQSIRSQPTRANVCSVRFQPGNRYHLAYGSADHMIRLLDVRKFGEPYLVLKGHRKAVSYVQYLNDKELVSASTDSELKLWSTETGQCVKTFRGHINEKNFVGLTVNNEYIACGSENNSFCVYHKFVSQPILKYKFDIPHSILPGTQEQRDEGNDFVSSVCFRKDSRTVLAANSLGYIKVLEMH